MRVWWGPRAVRVMSGGPLFRRSPARVAVRRLRLFVVPVTARIWGDAMRYRVAVVAASVLTAAAVPLAMPSAEAATYPLHFTRIYYDSPGKDDGSNASLNAEYVTIKNSSSKSRSLTGWTVRDKSGHVYKFGTFTLGAGKSVRIHTGKGTNTSTNRYWGSSAYIWNNTGDKAYLRTPGGVLKDSCSWGDGPGYINC